jgi:hypothetical protein
MVLIIGIPAYEERGLYKTIEQLKIGCPHRGRRHLFRIYTLPRTVEYLLPELFEKDRIPVKGSRQGTGLFNIGINIKFLTHHRINLYIRLDAMSQMYLIIPEVYSSPEPYV